MAFKKEEEKSTKAESERCAGQTVNYSWQFIDRDRFSQSKKRQEVRRSEKLAAALAVFSPSQQVQVVPVSLPPPVTRSVFGAWRVETYGRRTL